jgi:predicted acylesterase/phospholipase RssA
MKIWQACRATSAAVTFFEPIVVGDSRYSDGGLFYNNPITQVNAEGMEMFPGDDILIVSLGTGISSSVEFNPNVTTIASVLANIATRTTQVANDFYRTARKNRYYRFDVPEIGDIGLEEFKQLSRIKKLTDKYLNIPEVGEKGRICAEQLAEGELALPETPIKAPLSTFGEHEELQERFDRLRSP